MNKKLTKEELLAKANEPKMFAMKYHPFYATFFNSFLPI